jgi:translation elongation factor EF-G
MVEMHADDRNEIDRAQAGDILAIVGMKNVQTGHTLCDQKNPVTLEPMIFPEPVISIAVKPKDKGGSEKMGVAIGKMIAEDPRSALRLMKTPARPSLKVWVNCTWILKWISSSAPTALI